MDLDGFIVRVANKGVFVLFIIIEIHDVHLGVRERRQGVFQIVLSFWQQLHCFDLQHLTDSRLMFLRQLEQFVLGRTTTWPHRSQCWVPTSDQVNDFAFLVLSVHGTRHSCTKQILTGKRYLLCLLIVCSMRGRSCVCFIPRSRTCCWSSGESLNHGALS
jgi:hypothetical protein